MGKAGGTKSLREGSSGEGQEAGQHGRRSTGEGRATESERSSFALGVAARLAAARRGLQGGTSLVVERDLLRNFAGRVARPRYEGAEVGAVARGGREGAGRQRGRCATGRNCQAWRGHVVNSAELPRRGDAHLVSPPAAA